MAGMRVSGAFEIVGGDVKIDLADGRVVSVRSDGTVEVYERRFERSGLSSNRYRMALPTFVEVSAQCAPEGDGTFAVEVWHAH